MSQFLSKIIIILLTLLGITVLIGELFNLHIYFPLNLAENNEIPYNRMQSIRLSLIVTFVYFGIRYIFWQSIKMYPIQFLNIYLKSLAICSLLVFYSFQVEMREYYFVLFFFIAAIILHFASQPEIRRYFKHK
jgi:hypothetical protein|tara:strand:- start:60 stop:458 length:399 start_codon:yes stop_codon:yes gene_type:complete